MLLVIHWRQKSTARSQLKLAIEDALDLGLPRAYTPELYNLKCSAVFEHVYESYPGNPPTFLVLTRSRGQAARANFCLGDASQGHIWSLMIVCPDPSCGVLLHLSSGLE